MCVKDYISNSIEKLKNIFPNVSLEYGVDALTNFHILKLDVRTINERSDVFTNWYFDTVDGFENEFKDEELLISCTSDYEMDYVSVEIKVGQYESSNVYYPNMYEMVSKENIISAKRKIYYANDSIEIHKGILDVSFNERRNANENVYSSMDDFFSSDTFPIELLNVA